MLAAAGRLRLIRWFWSRRGTVLFVLLWFGSWLFLNGLVLVQRRILSDYCTDEKSKKILERLCLGFSDGLLTGDMCSDLCLFSQVQYQRCLYYENGKKVIEARWRGKPIILKSKLENFSSYEPLGLLDYQEAAENLSALDVLLYATLEIRNSLGLVEEAEQDGGGRNGSVAKLWNKKLQRGDRSFSRAELSSLWSLLQQEEYTFLRVLQDLSSHTARVLGSCGHFYAVEFLSAGHAWDQNLFSLDDVGGRGSSREKVHRIALSFLHMVKHFQQDFTHTLHLCDIKPENFAIRTDLTVVAIDVDMAFFEPKMKEILEQNCSSDEDCSFFDCTSRCDVVKRRCSPNRRNSNLQVICEKIFSSWFSPTLLGAKAGLPLQVELQQAVQICSETDGDEMEKRPDVYHRLLSILNRLIQEGGESGERLGEKQQRVHTDLNF